MSGATPAPDVRDARVAMITAPDREVALAIARALVERGLAACVNVVPGATSVYRWQGEVEEASEALLVVKTTTQAVASIERALAELHPYELPELVVLAPAHVEARYLDWIRRSVGERGG